MNKTIIIDEVQIKRTNELYDAIIGRIFGSYPGKYLRKVLADNEEKYGCAITDCIETNRENTIRYRKAVSEFIIESAKMMHQYMGIPINELPGICIYPYIHYLGDNQEQRDEIIRQCKNCSVGDACLNIKEDPISRLLYDLIF